MGGEMSCKPLELALKGDEKTDKGSGKETTIKNGKPQQDTSLLLFMLIVLDI